jgi:hypothetical protein
VTYLRLLDAGADWRSPLAYDRARGLEPPALTGNAFAAIQTITAITVSSRIRNPILF